MVRTLVRVMFLGLFLLLSACQSVSVQEDKKEDRVFYEFQTRPGLLIEAPHESPSLSFHRGFSEKIFSGETPNNRGRKLECAFVNSGQNKIKTRVCLKTRPKDWSVWRTKSAYDIFLRPGKRKKVTFFIDWGCYWELVWEDSDR